MLIGLFDRPVTFRKKDAIIFFESFWTRETSELQTWDISFRFKTTAENGVMVHRIGSGASDFIEIKLVSEYSISIFESSPNIYSLYATVNQDQQEFSYSNLGLQ